MFLKGDQNNKRELLVVAVVAVKNRRDARPGEKVTAASVAKFPTDFHIEYAENTVRKAFAESKKRVKYAAVDQGFSRKV